VDVYDVKLDRDYPAFAKFVDSKMSPSKTSSDSESTASQPKAKPTGPLPNPSGVVVQLNSETFTHHISLVPSKSTGAGWFVKFYVPWCSHCQHMAEAWTELARDMKGKLNIAEVNCEAEARLCKDIKLRGYPTIIFFKGGERVEYDGLRGLGDLVSFAQKAVQYDPYRVVFLIPRAGVHDITSSEFDIYEKKDEVIFLYFYDQATTSEDFVSSNKYFDLLYRKP
jgi:protein disulfide-isomerase